MATHFFYRSLPKTIAMGSFLSRSLSIATSAASLSTAQSRSSLSLFHRLRPLTGVIASACRLSPAAVRCFATNSKMSSLIDPVRIWSNQPPTQTILFEGCDYEHWLVVMEPPEGHPTRDEIIDSYIKTLAAVVGSEEEARMKIYSVSTSYLYAFGALVSEETSSKIEELPKVQWVLPDSYIDVKNKRYGGDPFIDGQAVPYDPKRNRNYSAWSVEESKMLLQLMVNAASCGWRDANGVLSKETVETKILPILNEKLRCQKTYSHYQSRLQYFKREYKKYSQLMHHNSGFRWDSATKKFIAPEEVWEDYIKSHPTHRSIQTKTCLDYEDLQIVIGNATAIGKNSLGLGDGTDARTFGVKDRQVGIEDFVYDDDTQDSVPNHNEASHQYSPLGHSSSSLPFQANIWEGPSESSSKRKQTRTKHEGNATPYETTHQSMERISLGIDSIATDFRGLRSLLEKREKDRERHSYIWDAIKETPNVDERARYKALSLLNTTTKKEAFLLMSLEERANWISYNLE